MQSVSFCKFRSFIHTYIHVTYVKLNSISSTLSYELCSVICHIMVSSLIDNLTDKLCFKLKIITNGRIHGEVIKTLIFLDNWADVCEEICRSNIIQRDNLKFARKLNKDLVKLAKERSDLVSRHTSHYTVDTDECEWFSGSKWWHVVWAIPQKGDPGHHQWVAERIQKDHGEETPLSIEWARLVRR